MTDITCPVQQTIHRLQNMMQSAEPIGPRGRRQGERILSIMEGIAGGRGEPAHIPAIESLAGELSAEDRNPASIEIGRFVAATVADYRETFESHIASGNCVSGECLRLSPAPCQMACPAGIDVPAYVTLIGQGRYGEAIDVIRQVNPFPWVCGLVCTRPCESVCVRGTMDRPVSIKYLKAFAAEAAMSAGTYRNPEPSPDTGRKVCVVGAGPAGLSAAYYLTLMGHRVKVFETLPTAGGMLLVGIPRYRLPKGVIDKEVAMLEQLGVAFQFNTKFGWRLHLNQLRKEGYEAFLFTTGAHKCSPMRVPGENDFAEVYTAVSFLREVALGDREKPGDRVVVIGGGNVAIDSARTCIRLGVKEVILAYRRSREEMPADPEEVEHAEQEGVQLRFLTIPTEIIGKNFSVEALRFVEAWLVSVEGSGRKRPVPIEGSDFTLPVDAVISAVGQKIDPITMSDLPDLEWTRWNTIEADEVNMQTSRKGVFAAGDNVSGPATVIQAIAGGRRAANSIDRYLTGRRQPSLAPVPVRSEPVPCIETTASEKMTAQRPEMPLLDLHRRRTLFQQVELGYGEKEVRAEAARCLRCDVCLRCRKCVEICRDEMGIEALEFGYMSENGGPSDFRLTDDKCILCGSCANNCPNDAIRVEDRNGERILSLCGTVLTRQPLVTCTGCGATIGTVRYVDHIRDRIAASGHVPAMTDPPLCDACARRTAARAQSIAF